jgi:hypothetical protein
MSELYKSILDDEATLIGNAIKDSKNPFLTIKNNYIKRGNKFNEDDLKILDEKVFIGKFSIYKYKNIKKLLDKNKDSHWTQLKIPEYVWCLNNIYGDLKLLAYLETIFSIHSEGDKLYIYIRDDANDELWSEFKSYIIKKYNLISSNVFNYYTI